MYLLVWNQVNLSPSCLQLMTDTYPLNPSWSVEVFRLLHVYPYIVLCPLCLKLMSPLFSDVTYHVSGHVLGVKGLLTVQLLIPIGSL